MNADYDNFSYPPTGERTCVNPFKKAVDIVMKRPSSARWLSRALLRIDQKVYSYLTSFTPAAEGGLHPKHRLMNYHKFFVDNLKEGETVLDVGCGNGALLRDVALKSKAFTVGVELTKNNIISARRRVCDLSNVKVIEVDVWNYTDDRQFDAIILSNVLEHMDRRPDLLRFLEQNFKPKKFLIRVPMFEREWLVPYKKELGIEWRLDQTHRVEYREDELRNELNEAGLAIQEIRFKWGEMYVVAIPGRDKGNA